MTELRKIFLGNDNKRTFIIKAWQTISATPTLATTPTVGAYTFVLNAGHGVTVGQNIAIAQGDTPAQWVFGVVMNVATDTITINSPIPYPFNPATAGVFTSIENMAVNGSATPQVFSLANLFPSTADLTRLIFHITDGSAMDDSTFGGIPVLTRGIEIRKKLSNGNYINYATIKNNGDFGQLFFEKKYDDKAPAGLYGVTSMMNITRQDKLGMTIDLEYGEELQIVIQDDLTGLTSFICSASGHFNV